MNVEQKILQVIAENSSKKSFQVNELEGFVVHRFLSPILKVIELPGQNKIVSVHMRENRQSKSQL